MADLLQMPVRYAPAITDADDRERALDVERSWIVEAPAGSGKTGLLIQRYLRLLAHERVTEPESVLAVTFTKAAAEEIRHRVLEELRRAAADAPIANDYQHATRQMSLAVLARDAELGWRLLDAPRRLHVRTIDGLCAEITRGLPILSRGGSRLRPVERPLALYRAAARRTWLRLGGDDAALSRALEQLLLHRDGDLATCEALVVEMLGEREQWGALVPLHEDEITAEALESRTLGRLNESLFYI